VESHEGMHGVTNFSKPILGSRRWLINILSTATGLGTGAHEVRELQRSHTIPSNIYLL
jgi:hypothetical protein